MRSRNDRTTTEQSRIYGDDLELDVPLPLGTYTVTHEEIIDFASQWDPLSIHIDPEAAQAGPFGEIIASGIQTLAIFQRLAALAHYRHWEVIAGKGLQDLRMTAPVRAGDTLTGHMIIRTRDYDTRGRVHLLIDAALWNQNNHQVMTLVVESLVRARPETSQ